MVIVVFVMRAESADRYRDATVPIDQRVEDLLGRMTLEEKVGQMNMPCVYEAGLTGLQEELVKAAACVTGGGDRAQYGRSGNGPPPLAQGDMKKAGGFLHRPATDWLGLATVPRFDPSF